MKSYRKEEITRNIFVENYSTHECRRASLFYVLRGIYKHTICKNCDHMVFYDIPMFMYDERVCAICGQVIDLI